MRVVVDTNVRVSALLVPEGPPGLVIDAVRRGDVTAVASWGLAAEIVDVLARPRLRKLGIVPEDTTDILALVAPLLPNVEVNVPMRDPEDLPVLAAALAGAADAIVTGDRDFLDDAPLRALLLEKGIEVLTPAELLARVTPRKRGPAAG